MVQTKRSIVCVRTSALLRLLFISVILFTKNCFLIFLCHASRERQQKPTNQRTIWLTALVAIHNCLAVSAKDNPYSYFTFLASSFLMDGSRPIQPLDRKTVTVIILVLSLIDIPLYYINIKALCDLLTYGTTFPNPFHIYRQASRSTLFLSRAIALSYYPDDLSLHHSLDNHMMQRSQFIQPCS